MAKKNRYNKVLEMQEEIEDADLGAQEEVKEPANEEAEKLDFDAWFVMRGHQIPKQHHKEIIRADFKGRGLSQHESLEDFDAALKKYGIKLA